MVVVWAGVRGEGIKYWFWGAWVAQSVKRPTSARSRSRGPWVRAPRRALGWWLRARSLFWFCVSLSLCPSPIHALSLSVPKINKRWKKKLKYWFCGAKGFMKMNNGDGCTTTWMYFTPLSCQFRNSWEDKYSVYFTKKNVLKSINNLQRKKKTDLKSTD